MVEIRLIICNFLDHIDLFRENGLLVFTVEFDLNDGFV